MRTIAYITDIHLDEAFPAECGVNTRKNWERILEDIDKRDIDEVMFGGDIGESTSNQFFFDSLKKYAKILKITLGNHDTFKEVTKHYTNEYLANQDELYYSYHDDFLKYIYLDTSAYEMNQKQLKWLENELVTSKKIVIFIHHPILLINAIVDTKYSLKNQKTVRDVLIKCKNEIILFCGHYHMPDERSLDNVTQYITPAASYQVKKDPDNIVIVSNHFGYRLITINEDKINPEIVLFRD